MLGRIGTSVHKPSFSDSHRGERESCAYWNVAAKRWFLGRVFWTLPFLSAERLIAGVRRRSNRDGSSMIQIYRIRWRDTVKVFWFVDGKLVSTHEIRT